MDDRATWMHRLERFALALVLVLCAAGLRLMVVPVLGSRASFLFFWPAILAATWFGGTGAGFWALFLSAAAAPLLMAPLGSFSAAEQDWVSLGLFVLVATPVVLAVGAGRRARREVEEAKRTLDQALEAAEMGWWSWDIPTGKVTRSDNFEAIHRLPPGSFTQDLDSILAPIHPEDRPRVQATIERTVSHGADYDVDFRVVPPGGGVQWINGRGHGIRLGGKIVRVVGLRMNVTERESAEQAQRHLAAIVGSSEDPIISNDLEGRILSWNAAAERLFGYREEEALGRSIEILSHPDRSEDFRAILDRVARGERVEHYETVRRKRDGSAVDVAITVSPIRDQAGTVTAASKIVRDLTAWREAQRERERTRQLFLATLGHDLRNPLNTIFASLFFLQRRAPEALRHVVARMSVSAERMARMIDQLLDFTRARLGPGIPLRPQPCDLREICATVVREMEAQHPRRLVVAAEGEFTAPWDSDRLAQVFSNLLANAIDHGSPAEPVLVNLSRENGSVRIEVSNRGEPIPEPLRAAIFEPFQRGADEHRGRSRGLGLGLYITREIVRSHGGTIEVESRTGENVFTVRLPVLRAEPD